MTETPHTETTDTASRLEMPAAARDFAARAVRNAQERAESLKASAERATAQFESGLNVASTTLADASRNVQGALYDDVQATLAALEKTASAKTLAEAAQVHVDYLGDRARVGIARMSKASEYLAKAMQDGAKSAQDRIAQMTARPSKVA